MKTKKSKNKQKITNYRRLKRKAKRLKTRRIIVRFILQLEKK